MTTAQTTEAIPTQPSSRRIRGTASIRIMSTSRRAATMLPQIVMGLEGTAKKSKPSIRYPVASVVYEKAKKPEPRECINGGVTKMDTKRNVQQTKLTASATSERPRSARTLQRL